MRIPLAALCFAVAILPGRADAAYPACTKTASTSESDTAHQKYIAGKQDYDEGNYESAVRRFRDAYALDCTKHELLVMISAAYERKGDRQEAISALEAYVERAPDAPDLATYQAKIENLKKLVVQTPAPPAPAPEPRVPPPAEHTIWPWVTVGAGALAIGAGVILLVSADYPTGCSADAKECTRQPGESDADFTARRNDAGDVHGREVGGLVTTIGGVGIVAAGLVWHFLEPSWRRGRASTTARVGLGSVLLGGTF